MDNSLKQHNLSSSLEGAQGLSPLLFDFCSSCPASAVLSRPYAMGIAIIHVVDDDAGVSKDFRCDIKLLLSHMKLLTADLQDVPGQDVEVRAVVARSRYIRQHHTLIGYSPVLW